MEQLNDACFDSFEGGMELEQQIGVRTMTERCEAPAGRRDP
eukprot:COSAG02_NODE_185_length_30442_cov_59.370168_8_plen_41_part_00